MKSETAMNSSAEELTQDLAMQLQQLLQQQKHFGGDKLVADYQKAEPQFNLSHLEAYLSNKFSEDSDKENLRTSGCELKSPENDSKAVISDGIYTDGKGQTVISLESTNIYSKVENPVILSNAERAGSVKSDIDGIYYEYNNNYISATSDADSKFLPCKLTVANCDDLCKTVYPIGVENKLHFRVSNGGTGVVCSRENSSNGIGSKGNCNNGDNSSCSEGISVDSSNGSSSKINCFSSGSNIDCINKSNGSKNKLGTTTVYTLGNISSMMGKSVIMGGGVKSSVGAPKSTQGSESPKVTDVSFDDDSVYENQEADDCSGAIKSPSPGSVGATKRTAKSCKSKPDKLPKSGGVNSKPDGTGHTSAVGGARRNERERNRVKQVNLGFDRLRQHVPQGRRNKKLSKVDTLRAAVDYIAQLRQLLQIDNIVTLSQESYNPLAPGIDECMTDTDQMNNWCDDLDQLQQQQLELHQQHLQQQYQAQQFQQTEQQIQNQPEFLISHLQSTDGVLLLSPQQSSQLLVDNLASSSAQIFSNTQPGLGMIQHLSAEKQLLIMQQQQQEQLRLPQLNTNPQLLLSQRHQSLPPLVPNSQPSTSSFQQQQQPQVLQQISPNSQILVAQLQHQQNQQQNISLTELLSQGEPYPTSSIAYTVDNDAVSPSSISSNVSSIGYGSLAGDDVAAYCPGLPNRAEQSIGSPVQPSGMPARIAQSLAAPIRSSEGYREGSKSVTNSASMASLMCLINGGDLGNSDLGYERSSSWID